jgi:Protein of unknown function (DUF1203)
MPTQKSGVAATRTRCAENGWDEGVARSTSPPKINWRIDHMHFRIRGLAAEQFAPLFTLSDDELAQQGAVRRIADARNPGYPCRVSLADSKPGDELILVNYEHHPVDSPYRMRFAIFVRKGDKTFDAVDTVPEQLRKRTLAVRAFDADAMMVGFELIGGEKLETAIERLLADPRAAYLHVHFAAPGCYAARVDRA